MAFPWITALKVIPWTTILKQAPVLVEAADNLLNKAKHRKGQAQTTGDLQPLKDRLTELENRDQVNADVVKQLAQQVEALAAASQVIAARVRVTMILAVVAVAAALFAWAFILALR
jgi:hypothetical protein